MPAGISTLTKLRKLSAEKAWNEEDHPRHEAGSPEGGQFAPADGAGAMVGRMAGKAPDGSPPSTVGLYERRAKWSDRAISITPDSEQEMMRSLLLHEGKHDLQYERTGNRFERSNPNPLERAQFLYDNREKIEGELGLSVAKLLTGSGTAGELGNRSVTLADMLDLLGGPGNMVLGQDGYEAVGQYVGDRILTFEDIGALKALDRNSRLRTTEDRWFDGLRTRIDATANAYPSMTPEQALNRIAAGAAHFTQTNNATSSPALTKLLGKRVASDPSVRMLVGMRMAKTGEELLDFVPAQSAADVDAVDGRFLEQVTQRATRLAKREKASWSDFRPAIEKWTADLSSQDKAFVRSSAIHQMNVDDPTGDIYPASRIASQLNRDDWVALAFNSGAGVKPPDGIFTLDNVFRLAKENSAAAAAGEHYESFALPDDLRAEIDDARAKLGAWCWTEFALSAEREGVKIPGEIQREMAGDFAIGDLITSIADDTFSLNAARIDMVELGGMAARMGATWKDLEPHFDTLLSLDKKAAPRLATTLLSWTDLSEFDGDVSDALRISKILPKDNLPNSIRSIVNAERERISLSMPNMATGEEQRFTAVGLARANGMETRFWDARASDGELKDSVVKSVSGATGHDYDTVNQIVASWADSSNKGAGVMMQLAAAQEFGTSLSKWQADKAKEFKPADDAKVPSVGAMRDSLRSMYNETQEWLKQWGVTHIPLYRGVSLAKDEFDAITEWGGTIAFDDNALSSWSLSSSVAQDFADTYASREERKTGVVLSALVPVERILSTPFTGLGCLEEREFVVIGSNEPAYARVYDIGGSPYKAFPFKGGPGSGNFDHAGRPGEVGGSAPDGTPPNETAGAQPTRDEIVNQMAGVQPTPPAAASAVPRFKNKAKALKWLRTQYPQIEWDISRISEAHIQGIADVFHRIMSEYPPELVGNIKNLYLIDNGWRDQDGAVMQAGERRDGRHAISFNSRFFGKGREEYFAGKARAAVERGWWIDGNPAETTLAHEFGHIISLKMRAKDTMFAESDWTWFDDPGGDGRQLTISDFYSLWHKAHRSRQKNISEYSKADPEERFAEAVGWLHTHPPGAEPPNEYVRNTRRLLDWLKTAKLTPVPIDRENFGTAGASSASVNAFNQLFAELGLNKRLDSAGNPYWEATS